MSPVEHHFEQHGPAPERRPHNKISEKMVIYTHRYLDWHTSPGVCFNPVAPATLPGPQRFRAKHILKTYILLYDGRGADAAQFEAKPPSSNVADGLWRSVLRGTRHCADSAGLIYCQLRRCFHRRCNHPDRNRTGPVRHHRDRHRPAVSPYPPQTTGGLSVSRTVVEAGDSITVAGSGFTPNSTVTVSLSARVSAQAMQIAQVSRTLTARIRVVAPGTDVGGNTGGSIIINNDNRVTCTSNATGNCSGLQHRSDRRKHQHQQQQLRQVRIHRQRSQGD